MIKIREKIYETRKKIENKAFNLSLNNFYICSISSKSIIYKGMFLAEAISDFFLDLKDKSFCQICNLPPKIFNNSLAEFKPFRAVAHNGG